MTDGGVIHAYQSVSKVVEHHPLDSNNLTGVSLDTLKKWMQNSSVMMERDE